METKLLLHVLHVSSRMTEMRALEPLLHYVVDEAIKLAGAERGYIVLLRPDQSLDLRVQRDQQGNDTDYGPEQISMTVFQQVITTGEPVVLTSAMDDAKFNHAHSVQNLRLRSLMCAPLVAQGQAIGALYVENRSLRGRFKEADLPPLGLFANQAAVAIANAALHEKLEAKVAERTSELQLALEQLRTENAERQQIAEELRWLASFDALTGVLNRRFFLEQAQMQFALARRNHTPFSVMMLDLDRFKQINDRYGHVVGDATLKHFSTLCVTNTPECSLIGRLGGEEFAIVLPGSDHMSAIAVGERIRTYCATTPTMINHRGIPVTVSVGIATLGPKDCTFDALLERADEYMYTAKRRNGNAVITVDSVALPLYPVHEKASLTFAPLCPA